MELIILILQALFAFVTPEMTADQMREKYPQKYERAETIISTNAYHIDEESGIVIIDDGVDDLENEGN